MYRRFISLAIASVLIFTAVSGLSAAPNLYTADEWARGHISDAVTKGFVPRGLLNDYTAEITAGEFLLLAESYAEYYMGEKIEVDLTVPDGRMTRQSAAIMLADLCALLGISAKEPTAVDFADLSEADERAYDAIKFVRANGIMGGVSLDPPLFGPMGAFTRQQAIAAFNNIKLSPDAPVIKAPSGKYEGLNVNVRQLRHVFDKGTLAEHIFENKPETERNLNSRDAAALVSTVAEAWELTVNMHVLFALTYSEGYGTDEGETGGLIALVEDIKADFGLDINSFMDFSFVTQNGVNALIIQMPETDDFLHGSYIGIAAGESGGLMYFILQRHYGNTYMLCGIKEDMNGEYWLTANTREAFVAGIIEVVTREGTSDPVEFTEALRLSVRSEPVVWNDGADPFRIGGEWWIPLRQLTGEFGGYYVDGTHLGQGHRLFLNGRLMVVNAGSVMTVVSELTEIPGLGYIANELFSVQLEHEVIEAGGELFFPFEYFLAAFIYVELF
jgi:hypothetical protein